MPVLQLRNQVLHPLKAFWWITAGNAEVLGLADQIGRIEPGLVADLVVLDARASMAMSNRMERVETLSEELFVLQMLGDDRSVSETYVAGAPWKRKSLVA